MATEIDRLAPEHNEVTERGPNILQDETTMTEVPATLPELHTPQKLSEHDKHDNLDEGMKVAAQDSGYNSSGSSHPSPSDTQDGGGELVHTRSRASSHASISSIPASTLTDLPVGAKPRGLRDAPDYMYQGWDHPASRHVQTLRQRDATFRKLSSVRAMQMHTEDEGDEDYHHLTPPKRRGSHRMSDISIRSAGSSPFKRSPFYSPSGTACKPKAKKEYPLVLLHCTLLSPSLPVPGLVGHPDRQRILREVLPEGYWKRWKLLEEKIGSGVLRDRGVLISHPEDMYDLLEERLLESLELQHPRLDHGHFLGREETESDREDRLARDDSSTEDEDGCPDCGGRMARQNTTRRWEVRVFAANGLMRAGAWAAAWKEMEKVDVEVGLWLPADVRADLENCLSEDSSHVANGFAGPVALLQEPENMQVEATVRALSPAPLADTPPRVTRAPETDLPKVPPATESRDDYQQWNVPAPKAPEIDLQILLVNYVRVLASDRRNVAIVLLSVLVMFVAINNRAPAALEADLRHFPAYIPEHTAPLVVSQQPAAQLLENTISQSQPVAKSDTTAVLASTAVPLSPSSLGDVSDAPMEAPSNQSEEPLPSAAGTLPAEDAENVSLEDKRPLESLEAERQEPSSTDIDLLPVESADPVTQEQGESAPALHDVFEVEELPQPSDTMPAEAGLDDSTAAEPAEASVDSLYEVSEVEGFSQHSETMLAEEVMDDSTAEEPGFSPNDQCLKEQELLQNEQHEPHEQNDANELD